MLELIPGYERVRSWLQYQPLPRVRPPWVDQETVWSVDTDTRPNRIYASNPSGPAGAYNYCPSAQPAPDDRGTISINVHPTMFKERDEECIVSQLVITELHELTHWAEKKDRKRKHEQEHPIRHALRWDNYLGEIVIGHLYGETIEFCEITDDT